MRNTAVIKTGKGLGNKPFAITESLDLAEIRKQIKLPVIRENMISVKNKFPSSYQMVLLKDNYELQPLGEVRANRPFILHEELMDWLCGEFDKLRMEFKLRINNIHQKAFSLSQQYLFNTNIDTPDRKDISPLVYIKNSFVGGSAFELHFGTFRYTCTNGATHTEEISHVKANSQNWGNLRKNGLAAEFEKAFISYNNISDFFKTLYTMPLSDKFEQLFSPGLLPIGLRKHILASLESTNDITVNLDLPKKKTKSKSRYLKEEDLADIKNTVTLTGDLSMWDLYNRFTNYTSTQLGANSNILSANHHIDHAFTVIAGRENKKVSKFIQGK